MKRYILTLIILAISLTACNETIFELKSHNRANCNHKFIGEFSMIDYQHNKTQIRYECLYCDSVFFQIEPLYDE